MNYIPSFDTFLSGKNKVGKNLPNFSPEYWSQGGRGALLSCGNFYPSITKFVNIRPEAGWEEEGLHERGGRGGRVYLCVPTIITQPSSIV